MHIPIREFACFALVVLVTAPGVGQTTMFSVSLNGAQAGTASSGTGSGTLTFTNASRDWTLSGTFTGLTGTSTDAHIHGPAAAGVSAGVVAGTTVSFTSSATSGTFSGLGTFTAGQATDLLANLYYINIHSSFATGGEIRGQLTAVPEPSTYAFAVGAIGLVAAGICRVRRRRDGALG